MANEQAIAKLRALKAEPGIQMHWQDQIDAVIVDLSAPPPVPPAPKPVPQPTKAEAAPEEDEPHAAPKSKVTTAAHVSHSIHKGK